MIFVLKKNVDYYKTLYNVDNPNHIYSMPRDP